MHVIKCIYQPTGCDVTHLLISVSGFFQSIGFHLIRAVFDQTLINIQILTSVACYMLNSCCFVQWEMRSLFSPVALSTSSLCGTPHFVLSAWFCFLGHMTEALLTLWLLSSYLWCCVSEADCIHWTFWDITVSWMIGCCFYSRNIIKSSFCRHLQLVLHCLVEIKKGLKCTALDSCAYQCHMGIYWLCCQNLNLLLCCLWVSFLFPQLNHQSFWLACWSH